MKTEGSITYYEQTWFTNRSCCWQKEEKYHDVLFQLFMQHLG